MHTEQGTARHVKKALADRYQARHEASIPTFQNISPEHPACSGGAFCSDMDLQPARRLSFEELSAAGIHSDF
jgi:hypothetical protein